MSFRTLHNHGVRFCPKKAHCIGLEKEIVGDQAAKEVL